MNIFVIFLDFRLVEKMNVFRQQILTQVYEIWQQSPTLIIFRRNICRIYDGFVFEVVEAQSFSTQYLV